MNEEELKKKMQLYLERYFYVEREVTSKDGTSRIDMILVHKSSNKYSFGIEVKLDSKKKGRDLGIWLKQAERYTIKEFGKYGKVIVCTYPQITTKFISEGEEMSKHDVYGHSFTACQNNINTFLGQFKIGELQRYRDRNNIERLRIVYNSKCLWNEYKNDLRLGTIEKTWL